MLQNFIIMLLIIAFIAIAITLLKDKKYWSLIVMLIIIVLIGIIHLLSNINRNNETDNNFKSFDNNYKIINSGYIPAFDSIIINNINEYNEFMKDSNNWDKEYKLEIASNKYDDEYFKNYSLALVPINTGSSSNKFIGIDIFINNNTLIIRPNIDYAKGIVHSDINVKLVLAEIDKNISDISVEVE